MSGIPLVNAPALSSPLRLRGPAGLGCRGGPARPVQAGNDPVFGAASTGAAAWARRATKKPAVHRVDLLVTVFRCSGFVGRHVVRALAPVSLAILGLETDA